MALFDRLKKDDKPAKEAPAKKKATKKAAAADKSAPAKKAVASVKHAQAAKVLVRPVITEKAALSNTYVFEVHPDTNKSEVKKAIAAIYNVTPVNVRIMNVSGKRKRWGAQAGVRKSWKKAIVRLPEGETINVYEAV